MPSSTPRSLTAGVRASLFVAFAVALLALTPRPASAASLICVLGQCQLAPGGCALYTPLPSMYTCTAHAITSPDARLVRDGAGASLIADGKTVPIVIDVLAWSFERWKGTIPPKTSLNFAKIDLEYKTAVDAAFRSTDRKVSEGRLASIARELKLPIPPMQRR